ncbi:TPA: DNA alkylation repair protein [Streptococcus pneumoniae]|nr:DNA alkylation repair protein [Streptococcus pneumoniae]
MDWDFADTCWEKEPRKYQYVAANYLKAMQSYLKETDLPKLEQLVVTKSWWETVDILDRVVGSLVYEHPELEEIILILFENLFKPRQLYLQPQKQCFEQSAASFLVCSLIFIEYKMEPIR